MNKYIILTIIAVIVLAGVVLFYNGQKGSNTSDQQATEHNMEDMSGKPAAQSHRSYELEITSDTNNVKPNQPAAFSYKIKNDKGEVLKNYEIVHEKIMHFIAVRKDLAYFQHLHPDFNKYTGEFSIEITFPQDGPYRLFPDFTPGLDNPQKLPVTVYHDINVGNSNEYYAQSVMPDSEQTRAYGDYKVTTTFPKDTKRQTEIIYSLNISKNEIPITNLENYLGALGHSVILKEGTLDFIYTHALEAKGSSADQEHETQLQHGSTQETTNRGPNISFATTFPESGAYKIFTQFQHEDQVQTVDYTVKVN